ncbi:MAG: hypothetical protein K9M07_04195 [Simkaniaceae bacterium]|nr:hypothetical protein [Simkaniaceae bacterium]
MRSLRFLFVFLITIFSSCIAQEASSCPMILNYIQQNLPNCGVLKNSDGFVYVDVDDKYIHKLVTFIQKDGFEKPPYFGDSGLVGAHITVIYPGEIKKYGVGRIQECGETIYFIPKECQIVHPPKWQKIDEVYFLVVEAPELDRIREKYRLPKREYAFHITIGVKPKMANREGI